MNTQTEAQLQNKPQEYISDIGGKVRLPLLMVPKDNLFDPYFPTILYRKGKFITTQQAQNQAALQYISKSLYQECVKEKQIDVVRCYHRKCAILRKIVTAIQKSDE